MNSFKFLKRYFAFLVAGFVFCAGAQAQETVFETKTVRANDFAKMIQSAKTITMMAKKAQPFFYGWSKLADLRVPAGKPELTVVKRLAYLSRLDVGGPDTAPTLVEKQSEAFTDALYGVCMENYEESFSKQHWQKLRAGCEEFKKLIQASRSSVAVYVGSAFQLDWSLSVAGNYVAIVDRENQQGFIFATQSSE